MEHILLVVVGVMSVQINANAQTAAETIETRAGHGALCTNVAI